MPPSKLQVLQRFSLTDKGSIGLTEQSLQNSSISEKPSPLNGRGLHVQCLCLVLALAFSPCSLQPETSHSWQHHRELVGHLCTPALKTSFKKLSLSYQPLLRGKRSSLLAQLPEGMMSPGRAAATSDAVPTLQGQCAVLALWVPLSVGHSLALASVCYCQSRAEVSALCSLSSLLFRGFLVPG